MRKAHLYTSVLLAMSWAGIHLMAQNLTPPPHPVTPTPQVIPTLDPFLAAYPKCGPSGTHADCLSSLRIPCIAKDADACHHYSFELAKDCPPPPAPVIAQDPAAFDAANAQASQLMMCVAKSSCWDARSHIIPLWKQACDANPSSDSCHMQTQNLQAYSALQCDARGTPPTAPSGLGGLGRPQLQTSWLFP